MRNLADLVSARMHSAVGTKVVKSNITSECGVGVDVDASSTLRVWVVEPGLVFA